MKKMTKKLSMILILVLMATTLSFGAMVPSDVAGTLYEEAITVLAEKDIITGDVDGRFHPDSKLTRAQACIMVVKAMNPPAAEVKGTVTQPIKSSFGDMAGYGWAEGYIAYAVKKGVVNGYPDGTFRPGNNVTMEEITAMVVRAAGYTDAVLGGTYPSNYNMKGAELGLFEDMVTILIYPLEVTKGMTAKIIFNGLEILEKANPPVIPEDSNGENPSYLPILAGKTFVTGSFNETMTEFNGKPIADDVILHVYGREQDYKSTMTLSGKISDFRMDTVYKFKNVNTPAWIAITGGEVTSMILPMDVGYTGYAYGVINQVSTTLNPEGEAVKGFKTLVAGQPILWLGEEDLSTPYPLSSPAVYELNLRDGQVKAIAKAGDDWARDAFIELGSAVIYSYDNEIIRLTDANGELIQVKTNAAVYELSDDGEEFTAGRLGDIKAGKQVILYDMSDDDDAAADIVLLTQEI